MGRRSQTGDDGQEEGQLAITKGGLAQLQSSKRKRWTATVEGLFLDELAASCNASRAIAATGFERSAVYARARRDPGFGERWRTARAAGFERVEQLLLQNAVSVLEGWAPDPDMPIPRMTVAEALTLVRMEKAAQANPEKRRGSRARLRSLDDVRDSILRKLGAIERAAGRDTAPDAGTGAN